MDILSFKNTKLRAIAEKVMAGTPVSEDDALLMLSTHDIPELGSIAHYVKKKINGPSVFYGVNMNLNYTNVCELRCPLCAFSCDEGDPGAYTLSLDQVEGKVREACTQGIDEVHIVGGINPSLDLDYFTEMLCRIKAIKNDLFIVAFTAVEYDYFARKNRIPVGELFRRLIGAGLGSIPGGGAEIFSPRVRDVIAPKKISGDRWLEVMRIAHQAGLRTNATMLYNHIETHEEIVDHMMRIRRLQDETGGFKTFVPLPFHEENTGIKTGKQSTAFDDIRIYAAARIYLHNIGHLKALWMYLGEKMAQVLLHFGVDDFGATYHYEKVVHAAGARTPDFGSEAHLRRLIANAGMNPVRTTAGYESKV